MDELPSKASRFFHQLGGFILAILGAVSILFGLLVVLGEALSGLPNWYEGTLLCIVPSGLVGIPLLIFGIRRMLHPVPRMRTEAEILARKNTKWLIRSWIYALVGGLLTLLGIATLFMTLVFIDSTDWDAAYFVSSLLGLLPGLPLLIVGFRRLKNVTRYKNLNWGWAALIGGGLMAAAGIYFSLIYIFTETTGSFWAGLKVIAAFLVLGVPILILGARRMEKASESKIASPDTLQGKRNNARVWGSIVALFGGIFLVGSISLLVNRYYSNFIHAPLHGYVEPYPGYLWELLIVYIVVLIMPLSVVGISLLIPGFIMLKRAQVSRQSRGWILLIMAAMFLFAIIVGLAYEGSNKYTVIGFTALYISLFLITGLLCLFFGIRDVHHDAILPANPGGWTG